MTKRVVYTCLFGHSETFNNFAYDVDESIDLICFTDDPELQSDRWRIELVSRGLLDPARASKCIKHLPHRYLPSYEESLYLDNTVRLCVEPSSMFDQLDTPPLKCFRHPWRNCVYEEANGVIRVQFDDPHIIEEQMAFYRRLGYPADNGLAAAGILLRRHHDRRLIAFSEEWNRQLLRYSKRDQLSFRVVRMVSWICTFLF